MAMMTVGWLGGGVVGRRAVGWGGKERREGYLQLYGLAVFGLTRG